MRATLIHNPTAGDERPTAADLQEILNAAGFQLRYQSSKGNWKKALQAPTDLVVAAGGDGTVAKVLKQLAGTAITAAILPIGTANNIARTLGIHGDANEIVATWHDAEARPFDIGTLVTGKDERLFVESAGGGLFAEAIADGVDEVEQASSIVGNEIDRALVHVRRMVEKAPLCRWEVEIDGESFSGDYLAVEAMNIRHAGPSVPIAPDAEPGDGLLDVVLIRERDRESLVAYLDQRLAQHEVRPPKLKVNRGRRVTLAVDGIPMRVDDQLVETMGSDWQITLQAGAVRLLAETDVVPSKPAVKTPARKSDEKGRRAPGTGRGRSRTAPGK